MIIFEERHIADLTSNVNSLGDTERNQATQAEESRFLFPYPSSTGSMETDITNLTQFNTILNSPLVNDLTPEYPFQDFVNNCSGNF